MNTIIINNRKYKYESYWRSSTNDKTADSNNILLPYPKQRDKWQNQDIFLEKLDETEKHLNRSNKFIKDRANVKKACIICGKPGITTGMYESNKIRWESGLSHYIKDHNVRPSEEFIDYIFRFQIDPKVIYSKKLASLHCRTVVQNNKRYLRLDRNQIMIMDALMKHGSYKQYIDPHNQKIFRYSEHAGMLDFNNSGLEKIIISGNTTRVDANDDDIFLPKNMDDAIDYEYIFHTHPATPKVGGRAELGVLFEFPSISDLFHFIDHYNDGKTQGSIVIAPEGMYIVRKHKFDDQDIKFNEDKFYKETMRTYNDTQNNALRKYGTEFDGGTFFSVIAQDVSYIEKINKVLNKYKLQIDYFPRVKDEKGRWIIDTVYLPIYVVEIT